MTADPRGMLPEFYDALLALLLHARENTRAEGFLLAVQVFENAAVVAATRDRLTSGLQFFGEWSLSRT